MLCKIKRYATNVAKTHFIFTLLCDYYLFVKIFFQTFYFVITFYIMYLNRKMENKFEHLFWAKKQVIYYFMIKIGRLLIFFSIL